MMFMPTIVFALALFGLINAIAIHRSADRNILRCKASYESCRFMWDPETDKKFPGWFTVTTINSKAPSRRNSTSSINKNKRIFSIEKQFGLNMDQQYNESGWRVKPPSEWLQNNDFTSSKFKLSFFD